MTQQIPNVTRRKLLGGVSATGIVALGFRGATGTGSAPEYTNYTYARTDGDGGPRLRAAWYSTYNDRVLNANPTANGADSTANGIEWTAGDVPAEHFVDGYDAETDGPLIAQPGVLPGDSGTIALGLLAEEMDARVSLRPTVSGALSEVVDVAFWYDTGLFGIGGCAGTGSQPANPDLELTLAEFGRTYGPGTDGLRIRNGLDDCLSEGERLCLGFAWRIDESVTNEWQGESVEFGLTVGAEQCGGSL